MEESEHMQTRVERTRQTKPEGMDVNTDAEEKKASLGEEAEELGNAAASARGGRCEQGSSEGTTGGGGETGRRTGRKRGRKRNSAAREGEEKEEELNGKRRRKTG